MVCYIYKITNNITKEKYVGQTTNFSRRKENHLSALRNNKHPNPKLQNSWNKYGEENFSWQVQQYDLTKEELDALEVSEIAKEDSFSNGYNLTVGGTGGNTRFSRIISFEQFCFIYAGNTHFSGMTNKTAQFIGCDSSTIATIKNKKSYDDFREAFENLTLEEQEKYLQDFIQQFNLQEKAPPKFTSKMPANQVVDFLCFVSCYGKGAEVAFLRSTGRAKGLKFHLMTEKNYFRNEKEKYNSLSDEEVWERADRVYKEYNIANFLTYKLSRKKQIARIQCAL